MYSRKVYFESRLTAFIYPRADKSDQASYLRGKRYNGEKITQGTRNQHTEKDQNDPFQPTADRLATEYKVSAPTIKMETAFNMWMGCYSQQEIAEAVGYGKQAVSEFLDFLQSSAFGMGAENGQSSENPELTNSDGRERKKETAFGMWLACNTQDEIAKSVDVARNTVSTWEDEFVKISEVDNMTNSADFDAPLYNVWKQQSKSNSVNHSVSRKL